MQAALRNRRIVVGVSLILVLGIGIFLSAIGTSRAAESPSPQNPKQPLPTKDISLEQAKAVLDAAVKKSQDLHINEDIAVVDAGGNLKAFYRMDTAWLGSIDIAQKKAKTSRFFDMPSGDIGKQSQPGGPLYMIEVSNGGLITFPGGVPIHDSSDATIGAIGASGSTVDNDDAVAKAGAAAVK